jgi:hypothetical protein
MFHVCHFLATFLMSYVAGDIAANFSRQATSRDASASGTDRPFGQTPQADQRSKKKRP